MDLIFKDITQLCCIYELWPAETLGSQSGRIIITMFSLRDLRNNLHGIARAFGQDPIYTSFLSTICLKLQEKTRGKAWRHDTSKTSRYHFESERAVASKSESVAYCRLVSLFAPSVNTIISYYTCYMYIIIYYLCIAFVHCPRLYNNQLLYLSQMLHGTGVYLPRFGFDLWECR